MDVCTGYGTTPIVACQTGRRFVGSEASPTYARLARERIRVEGTRRAKLPPASAMPLFAAAQENVDG